MDPNQWAELLKQLDSSAQVRTCDNWLEVVGDYDYRILNRLLKRVKREAWDEGYLAGSSDTHDDGLYGYTDNPYEGTR